MKVFLGDAMDFQKEYKDSFPLFVRMLQFERVGEQEDAHRHKDGHFHAVLHGRILANVQGKMQIVDAPALVWISAGTLHEVTALPMPPELEEKLRAAFDQGFEAVRALFELPIVACVHDKRIWQNL